MLRGDLVHIPQGALLLKSKHMVLSSDEYLKAEKPILALFWGQDTKEPLWGSIYYKENVWDIKMSQIYPITQEKENAS